MSIVTKAIALPALIRLSTKASKYDFSTLVAGSLDAVLETEVVDAKKVQARMTSALSAYKKRTGDKSKFTVRAVPGENGTVAAVGVWKLADAVVAPVAAAADQAQGE